MLLSSFMLPGILPVMLHVLILLECVRRTMKADTDQGNMSHASWQMRSQNHDRSRTKAARRKKKGELKTL